MINLGHEISLYCRYYNKYNESCDPAWDNIHHDAVGHDLNRLRGYMTTCLFGMGSIPWNFPILYSCTKPMDILAMVTVMFPAHTGMEFDIEFFYSGEQNIKIDSNGGWNDQFRHHCEIIYGDMYPIVPLMYVAFNMHSKHTSEFHKDIKKFYV